MKTHFKNENAYRVVCSRRSTPQGGRREGGRVREKDKKISRKESRRCGSQVELREKEWEADASVRLKL